jgi:arylsulfatase
VRRRRGSVRVRHWPAQASSCRPSVLYCKSDGRLGYHYSFLGLQRASISSAEAVPEGTHQVRVEFVYDGGGAGKGGDVTLYVDGEQVGNGRVERTHAYHYNLTETAGVGRDSGSPVCDDYPVGDNAFQRHDRLGPHRCRRGQPRPPC